MQLLDIRNLTIELTTSDSVIRVVDKVNFSLKEGLGSNHLPQIF